jgi:endo-1,4-beta-xylanase
LHRFKHWDVNNEAMHGHWYEDKTGNWQFTPDLIRYCYDANKAEEKPKYFVNDFNVISNGVFTEVSLSFLSQRTILYSLMQMYQQQVSDYVKSGVPINGMGIQSHLEDDIDIERIKV